MEHTPGPWTISESKRHPIIYIFGDGKQVASTYGEGDYYSTQKPNAHLIAAAPDLLEALEPFAHLADVLEEGHMLNFRGVYVGDQDAKAAKAAIAKARGEKAEDD